MRILNLYAGIGGNRALWRSSHEVCAIESDPKIADVYQSLYPEDNMIIADAHKYLEEHYSEFDFIWSSPPCPSHGQYRYNVGVRAKGYKAVMPDMKLYAEIIFLQHYFKGKWVVENVKPYYKPLIEPTVSLQRHLIWSNFPIEAKYFEKKGLRSKNKISDYADLPDISKTSISNKRQVLRNYVKPELGLYIFEAQS